MATRARKKTLKKGVTSKTIRKVKADLVGDMLEQINAKTDTVGALRFDSDDVIGHVKNVISSGSLAIDSGTGIGGLPSGRIVEVYGQAQCGKTTFTDHVLASTQRLGGVAVVCDVEEKKDLAYAKSIGVNVKDMIILQPPTAGAFKTFEQVLRSIEVVLDVWLASGNTVPLTIAWDSIASTPTETEMEDTDSKQPGVAAKLMRKAMRRLTQKVAWANALLLCTNQQYEKIGGFGGFAGVRRKTYGGDAIPYHASMRIELIRTGTLKTGSGEMYGVEGIAKFVKNNCAPPSNDQKYAIEWGKGFANDWSMYEKLKEYKYITTAGSWHTLNFDGLDSPKKFQQSFRGMRALFEDSPQLFTQVQNIYSQLP